MDGLSSNKKPLSHEEIKEIGKAFSDGLRAGLGLLKVRINLHGNIMPESHGEWVDLYTAEDVKLSPLEFKIISLGYSMELPKGYYAQVVPRSSTCKKWGIIMANSIGIIENKYCGDNDIWGFPAVAIRETFIPKGTRICQFRIVKEELKAEFEPVDKLGNPDRGGWGSTGDGV